MKTRLTMDMKTKGKPTMNIRPRKNGLSTALLTLVASMATISGMVHAQRAARSGCVSILAKPMCMR